MVVAPIIGPAVEDMACSPTVPPEPIVRAYCCVEAADDRTTLDAPVMAVLCILGAPRSTTEALDAVDELVIPAFGVDKGGDDAEDFGVSATLSVATGAIFGELDGGVVVGDDFDAPPTCIVATGAIFGGFEYEAVFEESFFASCGVTVAVAPDVAGCATPDSPMSSRF